VRLKLLPVLFLAAGLAAGGTRVRASEPVAVDGGARVHALIAEISEAQRSLHSLRARFRQEKKSAMLLEPTVSTGVFSYLAPNRIRWEYQAPERMVVVFAGRTLSTWDPAARHLDRVRVSPRQRRLMGVLVGTKPLAKLVSHFRIILVKTPENEPLELRLEPVDRPLRKKIRAIELRIDRKSHLPVAITSVEADGDTTAYTFSKIEINPPLDSSDFVLEPKAGATVETYDASEAPSSPGR